MDWQPLDPDLDPEVTPPPSHVVAALAVACGGLVGALARAGLAELWPHEAGEWAWSTFVTNLTGCAALAALLVVLAVRRPTSRYARPLLGTGVLGGYTTFSTFAVDAVWLVRAERPVLAAAYVGASVAGMLVAGLVGLLAGRALLTRARVPA
ncbi:MAG: fluoride efflux transporter FluC [Actinomycetes bacterium]